LKLDSKTKKQKQKIKTIKNKKTKKTKQKKKNKKTKTKKSKQLVLLEFVDDRAKLLELEKPASANFLFLQSFSTVNNHNLNYFFLISFLTNFSPISFISPLFLIPLFQNSLNSYFNSLILIFISN